MGILALFLAPSRRLSPSLPDLLVPRHLTLLLSATPLRIHAWLLVYSMYYSTRRQSKLFAMSTTHTLTELNMYLY